MIEFLDLPEEIILEIIVQFLSISECINLVSTCRSLHKFTTLKAFWLRIAHVARQMQIRPIPFDEDESTSLPVETIKEGTVRSFKLGKLLKRPTLSRPLRLRELSLPDISDDGSGWDEERLQVEDMGPKTRDPQIWAWLLKDGKHLMSMSKIGILRVWDMWKGVVVVSVDVMGIPLCWDYMMDAKGLTLIVNVETRDNSELETFRVWRYDWMGVAPRLIFKKLLGGDIRSNWIEGNLTGCVGIVDDNSTFIYVLNWVTLAEAYIETEFGFPPNLSAATSPETLFIYAEDTNNAAYFGYSLSTLTEIVTSSMPRLALRPTIEQHFQFSPDGVDSLNFWIPTCRTLWDGRTGVFSRSMRMAPPPENFVADYVTVSIVNLVHDAKGAVMDKHNDGAVTRHVAHWFDPDTSQLLAAPAEWDVCAMGTFAKTAVWMERNYAKSGEDGDTKPTMKICFAEFPPEEENARKSTSVHSTDGMSPDSTAEALDNDNATKPENPTSLAWWEDLIEESFQLDLPIFHDDDHEPDSLELAPLNTSPEAPPPVAISTEQSLPPNMKNGSENATEEADLVDNMGEAILDQINIDLTPMEDNQTPVSFGHICEYQMDEGWERQYGGIYTVDFDDARGIAAFATGSGKIVLLEFI